MTAAKLRPGLVVVVEALCGFHARDIKKYSRNVRIVYHTGNLPKPKTSGALLGSALGAN